ncbi:type 4 pilus major pilin [unidentified bacterial endosymbiont]|uniref:type 4 pilus major pilin n=1 Tax=unidentified bacterial endosymbiont TaxID=2355 RepID=UPI00209F34E6|nr:type 4 pilus major pilin [unidentified bacterial endosymbiont]
MRYSKKSSLQRGFTALELIIVLVVGFSIIALSASKMGELFSSSSTVAAMNSILELYSSARSLRGATGYTSEGGGDLFKLLRQAKMIPKGLNDDGTSVKNEWGGIIKIQAIAGDAGSGFNITYPSVPTKSCLKLSQNLIHSGNFNGITVEEVPLNENSTVEQIITACSGSKEASGGTTGKNAVEMVFLFTE